MLVVVFEGALGLSKMRHISLRRRRPTDAVGALVPLLLLRASGTGIGIGVGAAALVFPSRSWVPRRGSPVSVRGRSEDALARHRRRPFRTLGRCHPPHDILDGRQKFPQSPADKELFSVAPMMGHTNRHYRHFYRLLSRRAHLYTEMVPSSQICAAYGWARERYLRASDGGDRRRPSVGPNVRPPPPDEVLEVLTRVLADPSGEYTFSSRNGDDAPLTLHQLLATSTPPSSSSASESPVVLQLGGRDPRTLAAAAAIAAAWGIAATRERGAAVASPAPYASVNLNCGCPSNAVRGRSEGCALMLEADKTNSASYLGISNSNVCFTLLGAHSCWSRT